MASSRLSVYRVCTGLKPCFFIKFLYSTALLCLPSVMLSACSRARLGLDLSSSSRISESSKPQPAPQKHTHGSFYLMNDQYYKFRMLSKSLSANVNKITTGGPTEPQVKDCKCWFKVSLKKRSSTENTQYSRFIHSSFAKYTDPLHILLWDRYF